MDSLEEIKSRLTIEEVVGQYVKLQKAGRNFKGLCPFHNEKTPSFIVSPDKGMAYCFGCQKGGDIFKFVQLVENVSFGETVTILAERAGVKLPTFSKEKQEAKSQSLEINEAATDFYAVNLSQRLVNKKYLYERGLTDETIREFRLGYAPDSFDATYQFLLKKGFTKGEIVHSGLAGSKDVSNQEIYDRFRDRIIFPICNVLGKVIAFGGRTMKEGNDEAKYLNSPDSPTYNKSLVLYALDKAKDAIRKADQVVIVEGYMDVIASHQAGIKNVVATSGTALTKEQVKLLKRYTNNFVFAFDSDGAGQNAAMRAIELVIESDVNVKIAIVPNGKDPDECIRQDVSIWEKTIAEAISIIDFLLQDLTSRYDHKTILGKKEFLQEILPILKKFPNKIEQEEYLHKISMFLKIDEKSLRQEFSKQKIEPNSEYQKTEIQTQKASILSREKFLLGLLLNYPEYIPISQEQLIEKIFLDEETKKFYKILKSTYNPLRNFAIEQFYNELTEEEKDWLKVWQLYVDEKSSQLAQELIEGEVQKIIREINKSNLVETKKQLIFALKEAQANNSEQYLLLLNQYNQILKLKF